MKRINAALALVLLAAIFCSCSAQTKSFTVSDYGITVECSGFHDCKSENWDLQLYDQRAYFSVMAYYYVDLAEGQTPKEIYDFSNEDIFSRRENVSVVIEETELTAEGKTVIKTRYSAEKDGNKNYYDSYLVDFPDKGVFAWVLVTSVPSYLEKNGPGFDEYVKSMKAE